MMRRFTAILLAISLAHLTALDLQAECELHASVTPAAASHAGHDMASMSHGDEQAPEQSPGQAESPPPKCCMMAGTCNAGAFATIVSVPESAREEDAAIAARAGSLPHSLTLAPEPPPPKL
jgi:hypothetical protein